MVHLASFNSLAELTPRHGNWTEVFRGRPADPYVAVPAGLAYVDGHLFICDTGLNVVHAWDLDTGKATRFGQNGELAKPVAVAVGQSADGSAQPTVYAADSVKGEVVAFGPTGTVAGHFRPDDRRNYKPVALTVNGSRLYAADLVAHAIDVFSIETGTLEDTIGGIGSAPGSFYYPMGVAVDGTGRLIVSDMMNARVQVFDPSNQPEMQFGQPGNRYGDLGKPRHVAIGPGGVVFVADSELGHVHLFNSRGELLLTIGGPQDRPSGTPMPVGLAVAEKLPGRLESLVPADFKAEYYLFTASTVGSRRIALFAVGAAR